MKRIPKGWLDFSPYGDKVEGTMLFPFKTPLKLELVQNGVPKDSWFTPASLMDKCPKLRAVIDLTDSERYYSPQEFIKDNVLHLKMRIPGGGLIPGMRRMNEFFDAVDGFVKKFSDDSDALIGVHCTHGLNRTGYFICKYLVTRLGWKPEDAIAKFEKARGYAMYRRNYIEDILTPGKFTGRRLKPDYSRPVVPKVHNIDEPSWRFTRNTDQPANNRNNFNRGQRRAARKPYHSHYEVPNSQEVLDGPFERNQTSWRSNSSFSNSHLQAETPDIYYDQKPMHSDRVLQTTFGSYSNAGRFDNSNANNRNPDFSWSRRPARRNSQHRLIHEISSAPSESNQVPFGSFSDYNNDWNCFPGQSTTSFQEPFNALDTVSKGLFEWNKVSQEKVRQYRMAMDEPPPREFQHRAKKFVRKKRENPSRMNRPSVAPSK